MVWVWAWCSNLFLMKRIHQKWWYETSEIRFWITSTSFLLILFPWLFVLYDLDETSYHILSWFMKRPCGKELKVPSGQPAAKTKLKPYEQQLMSRILPTITGRTWNRILPWLKLDRSVALCDLVLSLVWPLELVNSASHT